MPPKTKTEAASASRLAAGSHQDGGNSGGSSDAHTPSPAKKQRKPRAFFTAAEDMVLIDSMKKGHSIADMRRRLPDRAEQVIRQRVSGLWRRLEATAGQ